MGLSLQFILALVFTSDAPMNENNVVNENVDSLATALRRAGATCAVYTYAGCNDSGTNFDLSVEWPKAHTLLMTDDNDAVGIVDFIVSEQKCIDGEWGYAKTVRNTDLRNAIADICEQALLVAGHIGWETNRGSYGTFTVYSEGYAHLEHTRNVIESTNSETRFDESSHQWENLKKVMALLPDLDAAELCISYSGSHGTKDINDIYLKDDEDNFLALDSYPDFTYLDLRNVSPVEVCKPLDEALEEIVWYMLQEAGHRKFPKGEGGDGNVRLFSNGTVVLNHTDEFHGDGVQTEAYFGSNAPDALEPDPGISM